MEFLRYHEKKNFLRLPHGRMGFMDSFIDDLTLRGFPSKAAMSIVLLPWTSHAVLHWGD